MRTHTIPNKTRLDGNGVFLSQYNRRTNITNNEVGWVGATAFAAWGSTSTCLNANCSLQVPYPVGPDGRGGNQPLSTLVQGNLVCVALLLKLRACERALVERTGGNSCIRRTKQ